MLVLLWPRTARATVNRRPKRDDERERHGDRSANTREWGLQTFYRAERKNIVRMMCSWAQSSLAVQQPIDIPELAIDRRVLSHCQRPEVRRTTFDLAALQVTQVVIEKAAL